MRLDKSPLIIALIAIILFHDSCKKDKECDRSCYAGTWVAHETCYSYGGFNIGITASSTDANGIDIVGFGGFVFPDTVTALVFGPDLIIQNQAINGNIVISGSGSLSSDGRQITVSYTANGSDCSGTWTKQ